ncbi:MAG: hypothetical protein KC443_17985 [Anaerolineales bacterium]|nr:hypothetical protein [Anaerolineales bacterium]
MKHDFPKSRLLSPWFVTAVLLLILLVVGSAGWWRATATGPQVQVPMFYDAHYLFPRPWTQVQEAPGVPDPAPLAFYGPNQVTQSFVSGADGLVGLEVWLAGSTETAVTVTLTLPDATIYTAVLPLTQGETGGWYRLRLPRVAQAQGQSFQVTLAAPQATWQEAAITQTVGGDRLGAALRLNEYWRPGNVVLRTYVSALPGRTWAQAFGEQLLPQVFRLRLQQYKPDFLKGSWTAVLLGVTAVLSLLFVIAAWPTAQSRLRVAGWVCAGLLAALLVWQVGDGRLRLPPFAATTLAPTTAAAVPALAVEQPRLVDDLISLLWTAQRLPEARLVTTTQVPMPAIVTPAESELSYALTLPRNGRFIANAQTDGTGELRFTLMWNETELATALVGVAPHAFDVDLAAYAGQGGQLRLRTAPVSGMATGYWQQPQLVAQATWLRAEAPAAMLPADVYFGDGVVLRGYTVAQQDATHWAVTLFWAAERPLTQYATVFVHWLDADGQIIGQNDAQPVQNSYPLPVWPVGVLIADEHVLTLPETVAGGGMLGVGLYDPATFARWPAVGTAVTDNRALLPLPEK